MKIINEKEFNKIALNKNVKIFLIYIISFSFSLILINLVQKA